MSAAPTESCQMERSVAVIARTLTQPNTYCKAVLPCVGLCLGLEFQFIAERASRPVLFEFRPGNPPGGGKLGFRVVEGGPEVPAEADVTCINHVVCDVAGSVGLAGPDVSQGAIAVEAAASFTGHDRAFRGRRHGFVHGCRRLAVADEGALGELNRGRNALHRLIVQPSCAGVAR